MTFLFQFVLALTLSAQAFSRTESFTCPGRELEPGRGVVCCDTLEGLNCDETQKRLLSADQIDLLDSLAASILAKPSSEMIVQNCFRTALELAGVEPQSPSEMLTAEPFFASLQKDYQELPAGTSVKDLKPLDVLVFEEAGKYKGWDENENTSGKHPFWYDSMSTNHALVYLGQGFIAQKENTFTAVSSISTLERSFAVYQDAALTTIDKAFYTEKKIDFYMRVFRKK